MEHRQNHAHRQCRVHRLLAPKQCFLLGRRLLGENPKLPDGVLGLSQRLPEPVHLRAEAQGRQKSAESSDRLPQTADSSGQRSRSQRPSQWHSSVKAFMDTSKISVQFFVCFHRVHLHLRPYTFARLQLEAENFLKVLLKQNNHYFHSSSHQQYPSYHFLSVLVQHYARYHQREIKKSSLLFPELQLEAQGMFKGVGGVY